MGKEYLAIQKEDLKDYFSIRKSGKCWRVAISNGAKPIFIKLPFTLNEDVARFAGLMPDGSLIKDLRRIYFHQKKDPRKIELFNNLIKKLFSNKIIIWRRTNRLDGIAIYVNSTTLGFFLYHIVNFAKSDEQMRVPKWVFSSPKHVKLAYLQEAFDMEGTILKKLREIRFVSKDEKFAFDVNYSGLKA